MEEKPPSKGQQQKSYHVEFKLQVLDWYYSNGRNKLKTATHFNIHTKRIRDWELNEAFLRAHSDSPRRRFRMEKAAADTYGNIGKNLFLWYAEEKAQGVVHTFGELKTRAVQLAAELNVQESFTVSDSWVRRWKKKYGVEDGSNRRRTATTTVAGGVGAGVCEEGVVEVETGSGNLMDTTGDQGEIISLPAILQVETDAEGGESIVYVSEPQPQLLAHPSEEVIDMVENPVTSTIQTHVHPVSDSGSLHLTTDLPPTAPLGLSESVELQPQSVTLGSTLLEHLLMSLNETKKTLVQQEQLTKEAIQRAEAVEEEIHDCKKRLAVLEQSQGAGNSLHTLPPADSPISDSTPLSLPLIDNVSTITVPIATTALSVMTAAAATTGEAN